MQTIKELIWFWNALQESLALFWEALISPKAVLSRWERDSPESVRKAAVFSIVPVTLCCLIGLPYLATAAPERATLLDFVAMGSTYYIQSGVVAICFFFFGRILRGKGTLRDSFTANLVFMANVWPSNDLVLLAMKQHTLDFCTRLAPVAGHVDTNLLLRNEVYGLIPVVYMYAVIWPATMYVQNVGRVRAFLILTSASVTALLCNDYMLRSFFFKFYHPC